MQAHIDGGSSASLYVAVPGAVRLVRSGRLGNVRSAIFRRRTAFPPGVNEEFDRAKSGGGVYDLLVHDVDMALHLFGLPREISATGFENLQGGVDNITAQFHYDHVDSVTISGGWHHRGKYPFSMEYTVVADNGWQSLTRTAIRQRCTGVTASLKPSLRQTRTLTRMRSPTFFNAAGLERIHRCVQRLNRHSQWKQRRSW
ncbi:MAG: Gfo/Idh/MocA family oxidoreductase [Bryobacteraceae bacterium]